jgi:serine/threonine protein phosphatase PrpC
MNNLLCVANVGDSECVLARRKNQVLEPVVLTVKHKASVPEEKQRIEVFSLSLLSPCETSRTC